MSRGQCKRSPLHSEKEEGGCRTDPFDSGTHLVLESKFCACPESCGYGRQLLFKPLRERLFESKGRPSEGSPGCHLSSNGEIGNPLQLGISHTHLFPITSDTGANSFGQDRTPRYASRGHLDAVDSVLGLRTGSRWVQTHGAGCPTLNLAAVHGQPLKLALASKCFCR